MIICHSSSPFKKFSFLPYLGGGNSSFKGIYVSLQFNHVLSDNGKTQAYCFQFGASFFVSYCNSE